MPPLIKSGSFENARYIADYRSENLGDVLVERVLWRADTPVLRVGNSVVRAAGYAWFRFWLPAHDQVVERYFLPDGTPVGTLVDICAPLTCDLTDCYAVDLLLDVWIDSAGQVTIYNEDAYDAAVRDGVLSREEALLADRHLRELTGAIARGRFPPPLVRNWRVDPTRLKPGGE